MPIIHINIPNAVTTVDDNGDMYISTAPASERPVVPSLTDKELVERMKELKINYVEFTCDDWTKCYSLTPYQLRSSMLEHLPIGMQAISFVVASDGKNKDDVHWFKTLTGWQEQNRIGLPTLPPPRRDSSDLLALTENQIVDAIKRKGVKHVHVLGNSKEVQEHQVNDSLSSTMAFCRRVWISFIAEHWHLNNTIRMWSRVEHNWYQHEDAPDVDQAIKANFLLSNEA